MRIVGGRWRGRALAGPPPGDSGIRPSSDRLREALFNILMHAPWMAARGGLAERTVLDACCGTGALGLEAVSRGAGACWLMDIGAAALALARANAAACKAGDAVTVLRGDVTRPPAAAQPCRLVFLDPPYRKDIVPAAIAGLDKAGWIAADAVLCVEVASDEPLALPADWRVLDERRFGAARIVITARE